MTKRRIILASVLGVLAVVMTVRVALAFTEPIQGADNATDVVVWYGDNLTITDLEDILTSAGEASAQVLADEAESIFADIMGIFLTCFLIWLAVTDGAPVLYFIAGLVCMIYGFNYWDTSEALSISLVLAGIVMGFVAFRRRGKG